jgi:hypothetical protein
VAAVCSEPRIGSRVERNPEREHVMGFYTIGALCGIIALVIILILVF